jgi:hypothetical protein
MGNETKTISLSLNFRLKTPTEDVWDLTGVNSVGESFELQGLGKVLMRLLAQLGHATKKCRHVWYKPGYWRLHAPLEKRRMAAVMRSTSSQSGRACY